jgi:hypothetical protein
MCVTNLTDIALFACIVVEEQLGGVTHGGTALGEEVLW